MKILGLALTTNRLQAQRDFYAQTLRLPVSDEADSAFAVQMGYTKVIFTAAEEPPSPYLLACHVPAEQFAQAWQWVEQHAPLIEETVPGDKEGRNPQGIYCSDPAGNTLGFVPYQGSVDKEHLTGGPVRVLSVGEVTLYVNRVSDALDSLQRRFHLTPFGQESGGRVTLGDEHGRFVLLPSAGAGQQGTEPAPIIMTIDGEVNAVDRLEDSPYYIHVSGTATATAF